MASKFTKEFLTEQHINLKKSLKQIAEENSVTSTCVYYYMKKYNITVFRTLPIRNDILGKKFGRLTPLTPIFKSESGKNFKWLCKCDCGNEIKIRTSSLILGITKSCGCLKSSCQTNSLLWKGGKYISGQFLAKYKSHARRRKIKFDLSIEYLEELFERQNKKCYISGIDLFFGANSKLSGNASIDRIDSSKGYVKGNVQWCDKRVNIMKHTMSNQDLILLCKQILEWNNE